MCGAIRCSGMGEESYPQVIPRPETARPGREAPWPSGELGPGHFTAEQLHLALEREGLAGQPPEGVTEAFSPRFGQIDAARLAEIRHRSAVLIALFEEEGTLRVLLTRRASHLRSHRGEVSFPGGRLEEGELAIEGASREAHEEVGLDPKLVRPVGYLNPLITFASASLINPVVALLPGRPGGLAPNPDEVERIFDVALYELTHPGVFHEERWSHADHPAPGSPDGSFPIWFFGVEGEMVWGATARMLYELIHLFLDLELTFH